MKASICIFVALQVIFSGLSEGATGGFGEAQQPADVTLVQREAGGANGDTDIDSFQADEAKDQGYNGNVDSFEPVEATTGQPSAHESNDGTLTVQPEGSLELRAHSESSDMTTNTPSNTNGAQNDDHEHTPHETHDHENHTANEAHDHDHDKHTGDETHNHETHDHDHEKHTGDETHNHETHDHDHQKHAGDDTHADKINEQETNEPDHEEVTLHPRETFLDDTEQHVETNPDETEAKTQKRNDFKEPETPSSNTGQTDTQKGESQPTTKSEATNDEILRQSASNIEEQEIPKQKYRTAGGDEERTGGRQIPIGLNPKHVQSTQIGNAVDSRCEYEVGQFAHPDNCALFYNCWKSIVLLEVCPSGLLFDADNNYCDYPQNVNCGSRTQTEPPIGTQLCPKLWGIFPKDCKTFYNCIDGVPTEVLCPEGLAFDPVNTTCDYPEKVRGCEDILPFRCSERYGKFPKGDPECKQFWLCVDGNARLLSCSRHKRFNPMTQNCRDEAEVQC